MIYFLLPAYNEEDAVQPLTEKIGAAMDEIGAAYEIVVVNDGSRDRTLERCNELAKRFPMHIINHKINRGLCEASGRGDVEQVNEEGGEMSFVN